MGGVAVRGCGHKRVWLRALGGGATHLKIHVLLQMAEIKYIVK